MFLLQKQFCEIVPCLSKARPSSVLEHSGALNHVLRLLCLVSDEDFEDIVLTPDEGSSRNDGVGEDTEQSPDAALDEHDSDDSLLRTGGGGLKHKGFEKQKPGSHGGSGMVLATGGVSRRLDFLKDRISKALSVLRSKKGVQLSWFFFGFFA